MQVFVCVRVRMREIGTRLILTAHSIHLVLDKMQRSDSSYAELTVKFLVETVSDSRSVVEENKPFQENYGSWLIMMPANRSGLRVEGV